MNKIKPVPYQVLVPPDVRDKAIAKAELNGVPLSKFMLMAMENFISSPIEKSMRLLRRHNRRKLNNE